MGIAMEIWAVFQTNAFWYGIVLGTACCISAFMFYTSGSFIPALLMASLSAFGYYIWFDYNSLAIYTYLTIGSLWYIYNIKDYQSILHGTAGLLLWPFDIIVVLFQVGEDV